MEINDEELEMRSSPSPVQNELEGKDEPINHIDPVSKVDIPEDITVTRKRPRWEQQTLQDEKGHEASHIIHRERKITYRFSSYLALKSHIIDS